MEEQKTKVCSRCGQEKPITEFYQNNKCKDGHVGQCKECKGTLRKERLQSLSSTPPNSENPLSGFQPRELIAELRRRGYVGELKYVHIIKV